MRFWASSFALLCACGGDGSPPAESHPCDALIDACLVNQQACVLDGAAPRCEPCPAAHYAARPTGCKPIGGTALSHDFPPTTTESGGEIRGMCRSWTIGNAEPLYVNAVEIQQDESSHHSNWTFVPESDFAGPDGLWVCEDRGYSQAIAAVNGGVLYAQSTQATHEVQKFPDGVVVRIPPNARIISDIHTLNTTAVDITGHMRLTIYAIDPAAVSITLTPFHLSYDGLALPPLSQSRFSGECEFDSYYQNETGEPLGIQVYYLLPHTHALGRRVFVETFADAAGDRSLIDVVGFNGEARGRAYDPPFSLTGALGLRFGCEFDNPTPEIVYWGFDDQEMCEVLGFAASPILFQSRIEEARLEEAPDGMPSFTGPCNTLALSHGG